MNSWPVQDAKARFSELLETCMKSGPQLVTKRGTDMAVLVPVREWKRLQSAGRPSLKQLLLTPDARAEILVPARGRSMRREPVSPR
jgi:prevent-host-death family protein